MEKILNPADRIVTLDVYSGNGEVDRGGYGRGNGNVVYFIHGGYIWQSGGSSREIIGGFLADLRNDIRNYSGLDTVAFDFDVTNNVQAFFLGNKIQLQRNPLFSSAICLKPVSPIRKQTLTREINKVGSIQDVKGRRLTLIVQL